MKLPWLVAGISVVLLVVVSVVSYFGSPGQSSQPGQLASAPAPDISAMSPRERADRLFNRVMSAAERTDTGEVTFFAPMAIQSYGLLDTLDADARYHLGLIHSLSSNTAAARAQADTLEQETPGHLLGAVLHHEVAARLGDAAGQEQSYRTFLENFQSEMASGRVEYAEHQLTINAFLEEAQNAIDR